MNTGNENCEYRKFSFEISIVNKFHEKPAYRSIRQ